jgi:glucoamylase
LGRGEYDLLADKPLAAGQELATMNRAGTPSYVLSEQVWDNQPPAGQLGFETGAATTSAAPLGWAMAQFIRLAWSIQVAAVSGGWRRRDQAQRGCLVTRTGAR